ncbi:hypothetical protein [Desulfolucanica intricata]|uniref:hypothetical protein n=1 Tax=Desulfolucanica intricata TaxID=1285191 RepID=UPI0008332F6F|nr:hypothetical protein [Desulfolucanica intricata]
MEEHSKNRSLELILFLALAIVASLLVFDKMIIFSVVVLVAIVVFLLAEGYKIPVNDRSIMWKLALGAFLLRLLLIIVTLMFENPLMTDDAMAYGRVGNEIARAWQDGDSYIIGKNNYGYYYFNALIFYATGYYPDVVRLINSIIAIGAALNLYFISLRLSGSKAAKFTFALAAYFPSFIVWSALNLKESLIIFFITYIVKNAMELMQKFQVSKVIIIVLALLPIVAFRFYMGILLGIVIALAFMFSAYNFKWYKRLFYGLLLLLMVGVSLQHMGYGFLGMDYLITQSLETIEEQHNVAASGGSAYAEEVDFSSPAKALIYLPVGLFYFIFGPLPWQPGGILKMLSTPEMFALYFLYLFIVPGILSLWRHRRSECLFLLIIISSITLIYAMGGSNMGGIYRVRFQVLSLVFLLVSHGMVGKKLAKWSRSG